VKTTLDRNGFANLNPGRKRIPSESSLQAAAKRVLELAKSLGMPAPAMLPCDEPPYALYACIAKITPEIADRILSKHHIDYNRKKKENATRKYAKDMAHERWILTHQAIAFLQDGRLFDGQNRLQACINSGVPFKVMVVFSLPTEAALVTDKGSVRSVCDSSRFTGQDLTQTDASVVRLACFPRGREATDQEVLRAADAINDALNFQKEHMPTHVKHVTLAFLRAAVVRAWYEVPHDRLAQFCDCMSTGTISGPSDSAARALLRHLLQQQVNLGNHTAPDYMRRAMSVIKHFAAGDKMDRVQPVSGDVYPIPPVVEVEEVVA
jgi:hypothetical protein